MSKRKIPFPRECKEKGGDRRKEQMCLERESVHSKGICALKGKVLISNSLHTHTLSLALWRSNCIIYSPFTAVIFPSQMEDSWKQKEFSQIGQPKRMSCRLWHWLRSFSANVLICLVAKRGIHPLVNGGGKWEDACIASMFPSPHPKYPVGFEFF